MVSYLAATLVQYDRQPVHKLTYEEMSTVWFVALSICAFKYLFCGSTKIKCLRSVAHEAVSISYGGIHCVL